MKATQQRTVSVSADAINARMERLPMSGWQVKARIIVGAVTFFDGFDQLMIAYSLPDLPGSWGVLGNSWLTGWVIAVGGIGMLLGALGGGWLADRIGRLNVIQLALVIYAITSLIMAFTHSLELFMSMRVIQGIGLGAEVPVAAAYIGEIARTHKRGRFVLLYETIFPIGLVMSAIVSSWVVPRWGYEWLFVLGAVPVVLVPFLRRLPESPRWLAARGRLDDADESMTRIENEVVTRYGKVLEAPRPTNPDAVVNVRARFTDLFEGVYLRRTLMLATIWLSAYFVNYGIASWLPTLYRQYFGLSVGTALHYSIFTTLAGLVGCVLVAFLIDNLGRRICIAGAMALCTLVLGLLAWFGTSTAVAVLGWSAAAALLVFSVNMALYVYTAELYPTRMRAMGAAFGGAAGRLGIIVGPLSVGWILTNGSLSWVFITFAIIAGIGSIVVALFAQETKERTLEEISE
ncbi:MFS transporter [Gordonia neofelifaecis]|uniref:Major facilitator transporter n=1 Tax=Gordonia neofelifaecis NRRL B-59395 TaxID=644548 RepID=F1YK74_9ACTN|nr:MFS transporter [Gordonia neofelifaecis]EGD54920.1 major facilitator transporter [Gordonia neofelifaecis NRRL B-59395]